MLPVGVGVVGDGAAVGDGAGGQRAQVGRARPPGGQGDVADSVRVANGFAGDDGLQRGGHRDPAAERASTAHTFGHGRSRRNGGARSRRGVTVKLRVTVTAVSVRAATHAASVQASRGSAPPIHNSQPQRGHTANMSSASMWPCSACGYCRSTNGG